MNLDQISREFFNTPPPPPPLPPHQNIPCLKIPNHNLYIKVTSNYFIEKKPRKKEREKERKVMSEKKKIRKEGKEEKEEKTKAFCILGVLDSSPYEKKKKKRNEKKRQISYSLARAVHKTYCAEDGKEKRQ